MACSLAPAAVYPGQPIQVTGTAVGLDTQKSATWAWTSTSGAISGNSDTAALNTLGLQPGVYTVNGQASQGAKPGQIANCSASFTVKAFEPPAISCSASPSTIMPGNSTSIHAAAMSPQNRRLTYQYAATAGAISGTGDTATLDTAGAPPGPIGVTCNVTDDQGHSASASTSVNLFLPPPPPSPPRSVAYSCVASPSRVRAGDPVELSVTPAGLAGDSVTWHSWIGVLDADVETSVLDTANLQPSNYSVTAEVHHSGRQDVVCTAAFTVDPHAPVAPWPTLNIVRIPLISGQKENAGFAVYTYILYRRNPVTDREISRFKNILAAVAAHSAPEAFGQNSLAPGNPAPVSAPHLGKHVTLRRELAPIVVPVTKDGPFSVEWLFDNYDPAFASQLLADLNCQRTTKPTNCSHKLAGDGPYLISTLVRLTGHPEGFLVQDLSGTSPEVGGQWVSDFMSMVSQKNNWTHGYTLQRASLDFAASLDSAGIEIQADKEAVKSAMAFFTFGAH